MKNNIIENRGLHLFASPHFLGIAEAKADLHRKAAEAQLTGFSVVEIHSESKCRNQGRCETRIADFVAKSEPHQHVALLITHASLLTIDLSIFRDWTLHMDERPANAVMSGVLRAPCSWRTYEGMFNLVNIDGDDIRSQLISKAEIEPRDVMADRHLSDQDRNMFARGLSPCPVVIEARSWVDVQAKDCAWYSVWTLEALHPFKRVEIASSDIQESLSYVVAPFDADLVPVPLDPSNARIRIAYFDQNGGSASSAFWETAEGEANLGRIAEHLKKVGVELWTCNEKAEKFLQARLGRDGFQSPCCEGINNHREKTSVAMMLSMKAQQHEAVLCRAFPLLTPQRISESREASALYQFAQRGASRQEGFEGEYRAYVYDKAQAERLAEKFTADRYLNVEVEHIQLQGFEDRTKGKAGRKEKYASPDERSEANRKRNGINQATKRARDREAKKLTAEAQAQDFEAGSSISVEEHRPVRPVTYLTAGA